MISVKRWISFEEAQSYEELASFKDYMEALTKEIIEKNLMFTGDEHQNASYGVPLFSDNKVALCTMREWGGIMADIWSKQLNCSFNHMNFYMPRYNRENIVERDEVKNEVSSKD